MNLVPIVFRNFNKKVVVDQKLVSILNSEIEHELKTYERDEGVDAFLKEHNWKIVDNEHENAITLSKQAKGFQVEVLFWGRPPTGEQDQEDQEDQEENEMDDGC